MKVKHIDSEGPAKEGGGQVQFLAHVVPELCDLRHATCRTVTTDTHVRASW